MITWRQMLSDLPGTIVSAAAESVHLHPFEGELPNLVLVTSFRHSWVSLLKQKGFRVFCLEDAGPPSFSTQDLLADPHTVAFLKQLPLPVRIFVFKPSIRLEELMESCGFQLLHPPSGLARRLENKLILDQIAARAHVNPVPGLLSVLDDDLDIRKIHRELGSRLVVQFAKSFSGNRTYRVDETEHLEALMRHFPGRRCRITRRVSGDTWTVNACVAGADDVLVTQPFRQITVFLPGNQDLPPTMGSGGNLFDPPPETLARKIQTAVQSVGSVLAARGFKGIFGADFLVSETGDSIFLIEINPRPVASLPLTTPLDIRAGASPLIARHIAAILGISDPTDLPGPPIQAGQLILRNEQDVPEWVVSSGTYRLVPGEKPIRIRSEISPAALESDECLVWLPERPVRAAHEKLRLFFRSARLLRTFALDLLDKNWLDPGISQP